MGLKLWPRGGGGGMGAVGGHGGDGPGGQSGQWVRPGLRSGLGSSAGQSPLDLSLSKLLKLKNCFSLILETKINPSLRVTDV